MTPTNRATPAQLRLDAAQAEYAAKRYPRLLADLMAMARQRRTLAEALDVREPPRPC